MTIVTSEIERMLNEYTDLYEKFRAFISDPNKSLSKYQSIIVENIPDCGFEIVVFGKRIQIKFEMVLFEDGEPHGQIAASLIKNQGLPTFSEETLLIKWFNYHGNIVDPDDTSGSSMYNLEHNNYLLKYVESAIKELIASNYMAPSKASS